MRLIERTFCICVIAVAIVSVGCGQREAQRPADGRLPVFVGIPPIADLVERIGGRHVDVGVLVEPGQDPHTFQPMPRQVAALGRARLFFQIGMPFENALLEKLKQSAPQMEIIYVSAGIKKRMMDHACDNHHHDHDHDHADHDGMPDPHVWLSPALLKIEAGNIAAALEKADPAHADEYQRRLKVLRSQIDAVQKKIEDRLAPYRGRSFLVFHPGFGYFADAYGLREEAIEAGGRKPAPKQLKALIEKAQREGIKTIFLQPQFDPHSVAAVAEAIGGRMVPIDGLKKDVLQNLEDIADKIADSFVSLAPASTPGTTEINHL